MSKKRRAVCEINVVPYIDVMLVLLIIFMITAPIVQQGVEIELLVLDGITHFETYRFIEPLKSVVPWIEQVWQGKSRS